MGLFIGLKSAQEFLSSLVIFLTLGGQSLPEVSEKSPFVRAVSSKVIQYSYISQQTKGLGESLCG